MTAYVLIIAFLFFLRFLIFRKEFLQGKEKQYFIILALIPVTLLAGLRNEIIGSDTIGYKKYFQNILEINSKSIAEERMEIGYIYLNKLIALFTAQPQVLFILVAFFISICIGIFVYKNASDPFLAILFFITLGVFQFTLSGMRQSIAIGITLLAMEFIKKRKLYWFLFAIFIAYAFHKSAILYLPAYFIAYRSLSSRNLLSYGIIIVLILTSAQYILTYVADILDYDYGVEETGNGQIFFTIVLLITFFGYLFKKENAIQNYLANQRRKRIGTQNSKTNAEFTDHSNMIAIAIHKIPGYQRQKTLVKYVSVREKLYSKGVKLIFLNISFISLLLWSLRLISRTVERVTFYYMPSTYLVLEEVVNSIKTKEKKLPVYLLVSGISIVLFIYRISRDPTIVPYRFF